jgi:hypothetical protein
METPLESPLQEFDVLFNEGPMGLVVSDRKVITSVVPDGQASKGGVAADDLLIGLNGESLSTLTYDETIGKIKASGRPLRLSFSRPSSAAPAASKPTAFSALFNPKPQAAAKELQKAAGAAGSFMKGLLKGGVQAIAEMDKIIGGAVVGAVDASTRQASVRNAPRFLSALSCFSTGKNAAAPPLPSPTTRPMHHHDFPPTHSSCPSHTPALARARSKWPRRSCRARGAWTCRKWRAA